MGQGIAGIEVIHDDGDRLRGVSWSFQSLQTYASELENVAIAKRRKCVRCFRRAAQIDGRASAIAQLQMSGNEIGVEMCQEDVLDLERMFGGERDVLIDIPLWVHN